MRLARIPADEFADFLERAVSLRPASAPEPGSARRSSTWPATCPTTCSGWRTRPGTTSPRRGGGRATIEDLHETLRRLLDEQDTLFEAVWQRLTLAQRATLRAVVFEQGAALLAADTRARHRLGGASSVQAASPPSSAQDLIAREPDGRYVVVDSLMREWVARKTY